MVPALLPLQLVGAGPGAALPCKEGGGPLCVPSQPTGSMGPALAHMATRGLGPQQFPALSPGATGHGTSTLGHQGHSPALHSHCSWCWHSPSRPQGDPQALFHWASKRQAPALPLSGSRVEPQHCPVSCLAAPAQPPAHPLTSVLQAAWRSCCTRRALERAQAAVILQAAWRGYRQREAYLRQKRGVIRLQSLCRGHLQRKR